MVTKLEIDLIIGVLNSVCMMVTTIDPNAAQNKVFIDIQNAISLLQSMGV